MRIGVPKEVKKNEKRVAATPDTVAKLKKMGFEVCIQSGAGAAANYPDEAYEEAGATLEASVETVWQSDMVLKVNPPQETGSGHETELLKENGNLISFLWPAQNTELVQSIAAKNVTALGMESVPRISRAQKLDALSSMGNIAGYRAVLEAANIFGSFFTGQITAAGKVPPAKVLVIGAGVAGLSAVAAAKGLGAIVRAFDTRPVVKDQVESLGGEFLEVNFEEDGTGTGGYAKVMSKEFIEAEMALFREQAKEVDIVITTALIPGKKAPILWKDDMLQLMKPGSVVVDLAAEQGGNCEGVVADEVTVKHHVNLIGYTDLTSRLPTTASQLYAQNLVHLLKDMGGGESYNVDMEDEVVRGALITHQGAVTWPPPKREAPPVPQAKPEPEPEVIKEAAPAVEKKSGGGLSWLYGLVLAGVWLGLHFTSAGEQSAATKDFLQHLTVFVLACFIGWQVVWSVTAALHTPLMSVTNAISGIIVVGGLLQASGEMTHAATLLGLAAIFFATINIAGGFLVTKRMLAMFHK
jgi:NAD(P) transhydrogenase subunit alpha